MHEEQTQKKPTTAEIVKILKDALLTRELRINKDFTYRRKLPKPNHVFYKILYVVDDKIVYEGAFQLKIGAEKQLGENAIPFIISELAKEL